MQPDDVCHSLSNFASSSEDRQILRAPSCVRLSGLPVPSPEDDVGEPFWQPNANIAAFGCDDRGVDAGGLALVSTRLYRSFRD
jgi:hypothetical protein